MAKHDVGLNYATLLSCSAKLLKPGGRLSFIIPAVDQKQFTNLADFHRLQPSRLTWVRPAPGKEYSRGLLEFSAIAGITYVENELIIRKSDLKTYSEEYIELTRDFYLGF
jgi:tRNA1(Val) A37 N6-methylase TrmN6